MRQSESFNSQARRRLVALAILAPLMTLLFFYPHASSTAVEPAQQKRRPQPRPRPVAQTPASTTGARKYSHFKHETHRPREGRRTLVEVENLKCADCHKIPSAAPFEAKADNPLAEIKDVAAATKPSAEGYPYHDSCVRCHRTEFFRGTNPQICQVCHTRSTPRLTARDMFSFPKQNEQAIAREFPGYFPHSLHQSVIARNGKPSRENEAALFVRASFLSPADTPSQALDNCATCHVTDKRKPLEATLFGVTDKNFKIEEGTFKTAPSGHASCFNCHWQSQYPTRNDCNGCHLSPEEITKKKRAASADAPLPGLISANAAEWFKKWPQDWPKRLSLKFSHESKNHLFGCTTCHINITQMERLNIPKADVPVTVCAQCHLAGATTSIGKEMFDEEEDITSGRNDNPNSKEGKHTCTGCHTTAIGSVPPPCGHYLLFGERYLDAAKYKKIAEMLAKQCKQ